VQAAAIAVVCESSKVVVSRKQIGQLTLAPLYTVVTGPLKAAPGCQTLTIYSV
jgi:hypothetical protein